MHEKPIPVHRDILGYDREEDVLVWSIPITDEVAFELAERFFDTEGDEFVITPYTLEGQALSEASRLAGFEVRFDRVYQLEAFDVRYYSPSAVCRDPGYDGPLD